MALKFTSLKVQSFDLDYLDLFWEIEDTNERIDPWDFFILRSVDGAGGPFQVYAGPFRNTNQFRDPSINQLHNWRTYFYKIRIVNRETQVQEEIGPAWLEAPPDLVTLELRRRFELTMQEFAGRQVLVYPALTSGFRCPTCFDTGSNERGRSIKRQKTQNCPTCFDMAFVGGFGKPVRAWMQIDPSAIDIQRSDTTERSQQDTTCRLSAFPPLKPKDMIVEAENVRWHVERMASTQKLRAIVHQEPVLHRIPRSDIRYEVPVDVSVFSEAGPRREFTRPANLESAGEAEKESLVDLLDGLLGE